MQWTSQKGFELFQKHDSTQRPQFDEHVESRHLGKEFLASNETESCVPTSYCRELSASFKGEKGHDIAEALLSLKHTVVGPLSPHFGATQSGTSGMPPGSSLTYPSSHQPQMSAHSAHHQPPYSPISSGQYHHGPSSHQYNEAGSASHNSPGVHQVRICENCGGEK